MRAKVSQDKEVAKQIIVGIVRQAGGCLDFKTAVYKAFYHAHVRFAETQPGYLSMWPIVRMPNGPGIHHCDKLLLELVAEERIRVTEIKSGTNKGFRFTIGKDTPRPDVLPERADEAIAFGVRQVKGKSAAQISGESHKISRAWRESANGAELNVYLDSMSEEEYNDYMQRARDIKNTLAEVWPQASSIPRISPV